MEAWSSRGSCGPVKELMETWFREKKQWIKNDVETNVDEHTKNRILSLTHATKSKNF